MQEAPRSKPNEAMGRKADSEKDLGTLKTLNPKLAIELEQAIQTGDEE